MPTAANFQHGVRGQHGNNHATAYVPLVVRRLIVPKSWWLAVNTAPNRHSHAMAIQPLRRELGKMRRLRAAVLTVAAIGMVVLAFSTPAAVATPQADTKANQTCVVAAVPAGSGKQAAPMKCFNSFAEGIAAATNGAVQLPSDATRVTQQQLDAGYAKAGIAPSAAADVVIGISYDGHFIGDGRAIVHQATSFCDNDSGVEWQILSLSSGNSIGAGEAFSNCQGIYWDPANCGPAGANVMTPWGGGPLDNIISSICWI